MTEMTIPAADQPAPSALIASLTATALAEGSLDKRSHWEKNQIERAYGPNNAILDNCHIRLCFAANDERTAQWRRVGARATGLIEQIRDMRLAYRPANDPA